MGVSARHPIQTIAPVDDGLPWAFVGYHGKSWDVKGIDPFLDDSTENFPASSNTYLRGPDSPQGDSVTRKNSCFVPVDNFVERYSGDADMTPLLADEHEGRAPDSL
jgi:hypothetical protein